MIVENKHVMEGRKVHLLPLQMENLYTHFEWNNDPELNHFDSEIPFDAETLGHFKRRFERLVSQPPQSMAHFEIHAEGDKLIGVASLHDISPHHRHATIALTIGDKAYWGRGFGRDAIEVVLDYAFRELGLHRVAAETFEYNMGWKRLVEGSGFQREGVQRDYLFRDDAFWDKETYALLEDEYRTRKLPDVK